MHTFASPRRGYCASCDGLITDRPLYRRDEAYCCIGCAGGGPCICTYEQDLADDGVDNIGLPFAGVEPVGPLSLPGGTAPNRSSR
jgi:hypothetical protein